MGSVEQHYIWALCAQMLFLYVAGLASAAYLMLRGVPTP